ncbi:MAG TPA: DUF1080 domain-containing protein [Pirellulales bacterium]|nr:DUF1080 domain-containing protein [Pirellulales bacterium]
MKRPVGYTSLFNGRDLTGWESAQGGTVRWAVNAKNKAIVSVGAKRQGNWLFSDKDFSDFRLRLEFRIEPQSDSGIALRTPPLSNVKQGRMAIRLTSHSDDPIPTGTFVTWSGGAAHPQSTPQDRVSLRPANKWNAVEIEFRGSRLAVTINGQTIQDVNVDELARKSKAGGGLLEKTGRIGLECRSGHVEFRDIEIQEL